MGGIDQRTAVQRSIGRQATRRPSICLRLQQAHLPFEHLKRCLCQQRGRREQNVSRRRAAEQRVLPATMQHRKCGRVVKWAHLAVTASSDLLHGRNRACLKNSSSGSACVHTAATHADSRVVSIWEGCKESSLASDLAKSTIHMHGPAGHLFAATVLQ